MQPHAQTSLLMQTLFSVLLSVSRSSVPTLTRPSGNRKNGECNPKVSKAAVIFRCGKRLCIKWQVVKVCGGGISLLLWFTCFFNNPVPQPLLFLVQNPCFLLFVKSVYYSETTLGACVEIQVLQCLVRHSWTDFVCVSCCPFTTVVSNRVLTVCMVCWVRLLTSASLDKVCACVIEIVCVTVHFSKPVDRQ